MSNFSKWTVSYLKEYCNERNIKIPSGSKKADIISLIEKTTQTIEPEVKLDPLTEKRQNIIRKVMLTCKKDGTKKILNFFKRRSENKRLKQVFEVYKLNLENPKIKEIRACLKYFQELYECTEEETLFLNQMITQIKYINADYVDPRLWEFQSVEMDSHTYDIPVSKASKRKTLNKITYGS